MFGQKKQIAWFFDSSIHLEAVSRLLYLIDAGESFGVICGPDGSGRTRVLTRLREEVEQTGKFVVSLNVAGMDNATALTELVTCISSSARRRMAFHELVPLLRDELAGRAHCGMHSVVLIDDLHRAQSDLESLIRVLTAANAGNSSTGGNGKLTVIAASDRPLRNGLFAESLLQISLSLLDAKESSEFVRSLARRHGIPDSNLHDSAVRAIYDLSRGNAARMSRVCELLGVLHETTPNTQFNPETVSAVINELAPRAVA